MHQYDIRDLRIHFPTRRGVVEAVRGVSFYMDQGECVALVGESGCGKSVTARSLMGLTEVTGGRCQPGSQILCHGENILDYSKKQWQSYRGREAAMIFQDAMTSLNPTMQIGHQIAECYRFHQKIGRKEALEKAAEMLALVGISDPETALRRYPHEFSGGMRQRVMIASALACQPELLIADEPTTALDVTIQAQVLNLLKELKKKYHLTIIFITHDLGVVANIAERVAVMYAGDIVEIGLVNEIFYDPHHPYTWALLSSLPQLGHRGEDLYSIKGTPPNLFQEIHGDAFAPRNPHALTIDRIEQPPYFDVSPTHKARTWLLDPRAPKVEPPEAIRKLKQLGGNAVGNE